MRLPSHQEEQQQQQRKEQRTESSNCQYKHRSTSSPETPAARLVAGRMFVTKSRNRAPGPPFDASAGAGRGTHTSCHAYLFLWKRRKIGHRELRQAKFHPPRPGHPLREVMSTLTKMAALSIAICRLSA